MSDQTKVDVLAVMDDAFAELRRIDGHGTGSLSVAADRLDQARNAVAELIDFVNNVATPMSEPLNSAVGGRSKEQRRYWMGQLRSSARSVIAKATGETP